MKETKETRPGSAEEAKVPGMSDPGKDDDKNNVERPILEIQNEESAKEQHPMNLEEMVLRKIIFNTHLVSNLNDKKKKVDVQEAIKRMISINDSGEI